MSFVLFGLDVGLSSSACALVVCQVWAESAGFLNCKGLGEEICLQCLKYLMYYLLAYLLDLSLLVGTIDFGSSLQ